MSRVGIKIVNDLVWVVDGAARPFRLGMRGKSFKTYAAVKAYLIKRDRKWMENEIKFQKDAREVYELCQ